MDITIKPVRSLKGAIGVPGDKSISHRAAILGALAHGKTEIIGYLEGQDCLSTLHCLQGLGIRIQRLKSGHYVIEGRGLESFKEPEDILDVGNSGTTIRLLTGVLASRPFVSFLSGDASIRKRPMDRIIKPLAAMGARIFARDSNRLAPICIQGGKLQGACYQSPLASAQVKSAVLLAGLGAEGVTSVIEPLQSRDHTERMLQAFGVPIGMEGLKVSVAGMSRLTGQKVVIPGDISSAAFILAAGSIVPDSEVLIKNIGINPTRIGIIKVLKSMGAKIKVLEEREQAGEPVADLLVQSSHLSGIEVDPELIPSLIDEAPILAVAAAAAEGTTVIRNASELRVKETDRIQAVVTELKKFGADIEELEDGLIIEGGLPLKGTTCNSYNDHRMAMSLTVAGLIADGETIVQGADAVAVSFPDFFQMLEALAQGN